jgi:undecaprenyl-diphosphatase
MAEASHNANRLFQVTQSTPNLDREASLWLHAHEHPTLTTFLSVITELGNSLTLALFSIALSAFFRSRRNDARASYAIFAAFWLAEAASFLLKALFRRERPSLWEHALHPDSYSFPSGHALKSMAVYGLGSLLLVSLFPQRKIPLLSVAGVLIFLIGLSRVYLGAHWTSDVLGGYVIGIAIVVPVFVWYKKIKPDTEPQNKPRRPKRRRR